MFGKFGKVWCLTKHDQAFFVKFGTRPNITKYCGQVWSGLVNLGQVLTSLVKLSQVWSSLVKFGQV